MPRSKESSDELRRKVVEAHEAGKGYKSIAKVFALHRSTVRQIVYKWKMFNTTATRPRSGRPTKLDTLLRLMAGSPGNENETAASDVCGSSEGEETVRVSENEDRSTGKDESGSATEEDHTRVSVTDTNPKSANVAGRTEVDDNVQISMNPLRPNEPKVTKTTAKRRRGRIEKTKDLKQLSKRVLVSPLTPSCSQASITPPPDAPTSDPAEHHVEDMLCCDICGACFTTEPQLEVHQAQHLYKMLHECEECGKAFQSAAGLKTHKKRKHAC